MEKLYKFGSNNFLDPAENDLSVVVIDLLVFLLSDIIQLCFLMNEFIL